MKTGRNKRISTRSPWPLAAVACAVFGVGCAQPDTPAADSAPNPFPLLQIAPGNIGETLVQLTVLDGELVYRRQ